MTAPISPLVNLMRPSAGGNSARVSSSSPLMGLQSGPAGDAANAAPARTVQILPPWQYPIPSARAFYVRSYNNVIAAGAVDFTIPGLTYLTQSGQDACIRSIVALVLAPTVAMVLYFSLKLNGVTLPGWDALQVPPVAASAIEQPFTGADDVIRVSQNTTITMTVTNTSVAAYTVGMALGGWFWPSVDAARLMGSSDY